MILWAVNPLNGPTMGQWGGPLGGAGPCGLRGPRDYIFLLGER